MKKTIISFIVLVIAVVGIYYIASNNNSSRVSNMVGNDRDIHGCIGSAGYSWCEAKKICIRSWEEYCTATPPKTAMFVCDNSKTISATFYIKDDKYVDLVLSDSRKLSVPHAISADGARYAKADESFVFWNRGDTAFITENGTTTFTNCVTNTQ